MQKKQVAIIDVGSSTITSVLGERGVNNTFLIKGKYSYEYDGFGEGVFFDEDKLAYAIKKATEDVIFASGGAINTIYVGVPGEFTKVMVKDSQISFSKKKKITESDLDALFDSAFVMQSSKYSMINRSAIVYELDDFRRLVDPIGAMSEIFKGRLSFILCSNYFIETVGKIIRKCGIKYVEFTSLALAEALYLIDEVARDRIALVADVGYITTTVSVIQGDGILYQNAFSFGGGYLTAAVSERFDISFEMAEKLKRSSNLSLINDSKPIEAIDGDKPKLYDATDIKETILYALDSLCERLMEIVEKLNLPEYVPLMITGGGISHLRGAKEYVSNRLNMSVEILTPQVPMMNQPEMASLLSLLDLALKQAI